MRRACCHGRSHLSAVAHGGFEGSVIKKLALNDIADRSVNASGGKPPTAPIPAEPTVLNFSNPSRSYDESRQGVAFWGYDQTFELSFFIEVEGLAEIGSNSLVDEAAYLQTFDGNRDRIHEIATRAYAKHRKGPRIFSYTLTKSDC